MGWRYQDMREDEKRILGIVVIVAFIAGVWWIHARNERATNEPPGADVSGDPVFQQYCLAPDPFSIGGLSVEGMGGLPVMRPRNIGELQPGPYTRTELVYVMLKPGSNSRDPGWGRTYCAVHALLYMDKETFDLVSGTCQVEHTKDGRVSRYTSPGWGCPHLETSMFIGRAKSKFGGWLTNYRFHAWIN